MRWFQAQDSFNADLPDGSVMTVTKGQTVPESHYLVRLDLDHKDVAGRSPMFKLVDEGEPEPPKPAARPRKGGM